jgi:hypothetical protein
LMNLNIQFQRIYAYILTTSFSYPFFAFISNCGPSLPNHNAHVHCPPTKSLLD